MIITIGIIFLVLGFMLMIPSDSVPGSVAIRNVRIGSSHIVNTPGYQGDLGRRGKWVKVLVGCAFFGLGLLLIALGS